MITEEELQEKWNDLIEEHKYQRNGLESVLPKFLIWALLKMQEHLYEDLMEKMHGSLEL